MSLGEAFQLHAICIRSLMSLGDFSIEFYSVLYISWALLIVPTLKFMNSVSYSCIPWIHAI